jgi:hypothetical protein
MGGGSSSGGGGGGGGGGSSSLEEAAASSLDFRAKTTWKSISKRAFKPRNSNLQTTFRFSGKSRKLLKPAVNCAAGDLDAFAIKGWFII